MTSYGFGDSKYYLGFRDACASYHSLVSILFIFIASLAADEWILRQGRPIDFSTFFFFFKDFIYLFLEGVGRGKRRETSLCERYIDRLPLARPNWGPSPQLRHMCPYWESNRWPFSSQAGPQPTEPYWLGQFFYFSIEERNVQKKSQYNVVLKLSCSVQMHFFLKILFIYF